MTTDQFSPANAHSTVRRPRLLDLFCGVGGAAVGYHRAGFEVVGVDHVNQPNYPFEFVQDDALEYLRDLVNLAHSIQFFDAIHASPPCQAYTRYRNRPNHVRDSVDLISPTRPLLEASGLPWVMENVEGAPLRDPAMLCGSSFGLDIRRHRFFETNWTLLVPPCQHGWQRGRRLYKPATNRKNYRDTIEIGTWRIPFDVQAKAMEIDWMSPRNYNDRPKGGWGHFGSELSQAIPPAYTELIGHQLLQHLNARAQSSEDASPTSEVTKSVS